MEVLWADSKKLSRFSRPMDGSMVTFIWLDLRRRDVQQAHRMA